MNDYLDIEAKASEMDAWKSKMAIDGYFARPNKTHREWVHLSRLVRLLRTNGETLPSYARKGESPDFLLRDPESDRFGVEITEVLEPGFKRGDYIRRVKESGYKLVEPIDEFVEEPWAPLRDCLSKKAEKSYASSSWLLIVFQIGRFSMRDFECPFHQQLLNEHGTNPLPHLGAFQRVLVLSSNLKCLTQLSPQAKVLVEDTRDLSGDIE